MVDVLVDVLEVVVVVVVLLVVVVLTDVVVIVVVWQSQYPQVVFPSPCPQFVV